MLEYVIGFFMGMVLTYFFSYIVALGHSINVLKQTQKDCAALFITSEQGLQEIFHIKYLAMKDSSRSEQNITAQKYIDQMSLKSVRKAIFRNYIGVFPKKYGHIMEYSSWEEMEDYVNSLIKSGKKI